MNLQDIAAAIAIVFALGTAFLAASRWLWRRWHPSPPPRTRPVVTVAEYSPDIEDPFTIPPPVQVRNVGLEAALNIEIETWLSGNQLAPGERRLPNFSHRILALNPGEAVETSNFAKSAGAEDVRDLPKSGLFDDGDYRHFWFYQQASYEDPSGRRYEVGLAS